MPSLRGCRRIALDTENRDESLKALGPGYRRGGYVAGFSIATDRGYRAYLPLRHEGGDNVEDPDRIWDWARYELNNFDGEVVGAYLLYDLGWFARYDIVFSRVKRFKDVLVAASLLNEWRFNFSLDAIGEEYLGEGKNEALLRQAAEAYGWKKVGEVKSNLWRLPGRYVGPYGETDSDLPLRLLPVLEKKLHEEELDQIWDVESRLIPVIHEMQENGMPLDVRYAEELYVKLSAERDEWQNRARAIGGPKIVLTETDSFVSALKERGVDVPKTKPTKTFPEGKDSVTSGLLKLYAGDPLVDAIAAGKKLNTVLSLTIDSALRHQVNGRVHPTVHQLRGSKEEGIDDEEGGGGTPARTSCTHPNIQQQPARDPRLGPLCRRMYPAEAGEVYVSRDVSQFQFRLLVHFARGPGAEDARRAYREDPKTDFHVLAGQLLGADMTSEFVRKRVKNTNFAKVFTAGIRRIAETFGCSVDEAAAFVEKYDARLPFAAETQRQATHWANRRGFIITVLNRRQRFPFWEPRRGKGPALLRERAIAAYGEHNLKRAKTKDALVYKLQGSEADIMKLGMVLAREAGLTARDALGPFFSLVHDELNYSSPQTTRSLEASKELGRLLETCVELRVPILVGEKTGPTWGDLK